MEVTHPEAGIILYFRDHCNPVMTCAYMSTTDLEAALQYACHVSALQDTIFIWKELADHISMGYIMILTWSGVHDLYGLCLSLVGIIDQYYHYTRLIYDYMWISLNLAFLC